MSLSTAKGMILIANVANTYHSDFESYRKLMGSILRKRTPSGDVRFDQLHAAVYFSWDQVMNDEGLYFWTNLRVGSPTQDGVAELARPISRAWPRGG
jgi:hypothetical protein